MKDTAFDDHALGITGMFIIVQGIVDLNGGVLIFMILLGVAAVWHASSNLGRRRRGRMLR